MKKRILIDMDGVLADVYQPLMEYQYTKREKYISAEQLNGIKESEAFPDLKEIVTQNRFFYHAPLMAASIEGLKYLNDKYEVLIVSAATEFPGCINDKQQWLEEHFPFINHRQMIFCGRKDCVMGDIMIDDHPKNLDYFMGEKILFTQPHNFQLNKAEYTRMNSWKEIMKSL